MVKVAEFKQAEPRSPVPVAAQAAPAKEPTFTPTAIAAVLAKPPVAPIAIAADEPLETVDRGPTSRASAGRDQPLHSRPRSALRRLAAKPLAPVTSQETLKRAFAQPGAAAPKATPARTSLGCQSSASLPLQAKASDWVVQLGAFDSAALAQNAVGRNSASRVRP